MLTISKPLSASQARTYHAKEFTSAEQNYWKQDDRTLGEWHGKLAEKFSLAGGVEEEHFARLADGQHPITAEQLVRHRIVQEYEGADGKTVAPVEHRAGWDGDLGRRAVGTARSGGGAGGMDLGLVRALRRSLHRLRLPDRLFVPGSSGGSFGTDTEDVFPTARDGDLPESRNAFYGVRCARSP